MLSNAKNGLYFQEQLKWVIKLVIWCLLGYMSLYILLYFGGYFPVAKDLMLPWLPGWIFFLLSIFFYTYGCTVILKIYLLRFRPGF